jgi:hypothetical protein
MRGVLGEEGREEGRAVGGATTAPGMSPRVLTPDTDMVTSL